MSAENDYHSLVSEDRPTLADLPVGTEGTVLDVRLPRPVTRRLMEMGLLPGTRVAVVRLAPLGDPMVLRVRSYSLSIRRQEAAGVVLSDVSASAVALEVSARAAPAPVEGAAERVRVKAPGRPVS
jgi:ferrous iron transport protein A